MGNILELGEILYVTRPIKHSKVHNPVPRQLLLAILVSSYFYNCSHRQHDMRQLQEEECEAPSSDLPSLKTLAHAFVRLHHPLDVPIRKTQHLEQVFVLSFTVAIAPAGHQALLAPLPPPTSG